MPSSSLPLVTIGTLCFNTGKYVIEALECVKAQGYPNIQHIIIDDCSTDDSVSLVEEWIQRNSYPCRFIKHDVNRGIHFGLAEIITLAEGKYFAMISDDLWALDKLNSMVKLFETLDESYAMVYGDTRMIDEEGKVTQPSMFRYHRGDNFSPRSGYIFPEVVKGFYFWVQSSLISLSHFREIRYEFDPQILSEDWDWQLALSRAFNILGADTIWSSYRYRRKSLGREIWTEKGMWKVYLSHTKMFLRYVNHPKNTKSEKRLLIRSIWHYYKHLIGRPAFKKEDRIELLDEIIKETGRLEFVVVKGFLILGYGERHIGNLLIGRL